jgi:hypothetical protein
LRVLKDSPENATAERLTAWLGFRVAMDSHEAIGRKDELRQELMKRSDQLREMACDHLATLHIDEKRLRRLHEFDELTLGVIDRDDLLDWYCEYLTEAGLETAKEEFVYEIALWSSYRATARAIKKFEWLWDLSEKKPKLAAIRDRNLSMPIPNWQTEHSETRAQRIAEREATRAKNRREFEEHQAEIRSAANIGWLDWLAKIYFGLFIDVDQKKRAHERLISELGEANASIAIEAFRALLRRADLPRLQEHVDLNAQGKYHSASYPIEAGLDEEWTIVTELSSFPDEFLKSALAIDLFCPVPY